MQGTIPEEEFDPAIYDRLNVQAPTPTPTVGPNNQQSQVSAGNKPGGILGTLGDIGNSIFPRTKQFAETIGNVGVLNKFLPKIEEQQAGAQEGLRNLIKVAQRTTDPQEKQRLLGIVNRLSEEQGGASQNFLKNTTQNLPKNNLESIRQAFGMAGEVGPALVSGPLQLGKQGVAQGAARAASSPLGNIARSGLSATVTGSIYGATDPESDNLLTSGLVGGVTGGAFGLGTAAAGEGIRALWRAATKAIPKDILLRTLNIPLKRGTDPEKIVSMALEKRIPGNFNQMGSWADDVSKVAEKELQSLDSPALTFQQLINDPNVDLGLAQQVVADLGDEFGQKLQGGKQKELGVILNKITTGTPLDFSDQLSLKRYLQIGYANKSPLDISATTRSARQTLADAITNTIKNQQTNTETGQRVSELLATEQMAKLIKQASTPAQLSAMKKSLPGFFETSLLLGSLGAGAFTNPAVAAPGVAAVGLSRAGRSPAVASALSRLGQMTPTIDQNSNALNLINRLLQQRAADYANQAK
jgi:hypothetical protein